MSEETFSYKELEKRLQESEIRFRRLFENVKDGMAVYVENR